MSNLWCLHIGDLQWVSWSSFIQNVSCAVLMYSSLSAQILWDLVMIVQLFRILGNNWWMSDSLWMPLMPGAEMTHAREAEHSFDRCRCGPHFKWVIVCIYIGSCASSPAWHWIMKNSYSCDVKYILEGVHISSMLYCCALFSSTGNYIMNQSHLSSCRINNWNTSCSMLWVQYQIFGVNTEDCSVVWLMQAEVHPKSLAGVLVHCLCWSLVGKVIHMHCHLTNAIVQAKVIPAGRSMHTQIYPLSHLRPTLSTTEVSST